MKISPIIQQLREYCPSFERRIGGTADIPSAEQSASLDFPCAFVMPPQDSPQDVKTVTDYRQSVDVTLDVYIYVPTCLDERGKDAYDLADTLKREVIKALAGFEPEDCNDWLSFSGAEVVAVNAAYLSYRLTFACQYEIVDGDTWHGVEIDSLGPFKRLHLNVTDKDDTSKTVATADFEFTGD